MIKYNLNNINDWNYGDDNIKKVYYHNSICFEKISKGETYNLFGKTKLGSPFTIKLNGVDETVTIVKDNGDGTYDWGLKYSNPITDTTSMCGVIKTLLISFNWGDADVSNLTSIGNNAFLQCYLLTNIVIPNGVTSIGNSAFSTCGSLTSIEIPSSVTSIGESAFNQCSGLKSITIPNSVTTINRSAFYGCNGLTSVTIPSSVSNIRANAFQDCSSLTSITVNRTTPPSSDMYFNNLFDNTNNCPIYVPAESVNAYKSANGWKKYASRIFPIQ